MPAKCVSRIVRMEGLTATKPLPPTGGNILAYATMKSNRATVEIGGRNFFPVLRVDLRKKFCAAIYATRRGVLGDALCGGRCGLAVPRRGRLFAFPAHADDF